MAFVTSLAAV